MGMEVGNALLQIRDRCLYKATHATFESYCEERWGMSWRHAYRLMDAAETVENLNSCPIGQESEQASAPDAILPATESQARPLARLEPEEQRTAWKEAVETAPL